MPTNDVMTVATPLNDPAGNYTAYYAKIKREDLANATSPNPSDFKSSQGSLQVKIVHEKKSAIHNHQGTTLVSVTVTMHPNSGELLYTLVSDTLSIEVQGSKEFVFERARAAIKEFSTFLDRMQEKV